MTDYTDEQTLNKLGNVEQLTELLYFVVLLFLVADAIGRLKSQFYRHICIDFRLKFYTIIVFHGRVTECLDTECLVTECLDAECLVTNTYV